MYAYFVSSVVADQWFCTSFWQATPTAAPTAAPWVRERGCCREKQGDQSHHATADTKVMRMSSQLKAIVACEKLCSSVQACTAYEVHKVGKKRSKRFKCELHTASIDSVSRRTKSCKKAVCAFAANVV